MGLIHAGIRLASVVPRIETRSLRKHSQLWQAAKRSDIVRAEPQEVRRATQVRGDLVELFYELESAKVVLGPAGLKKDNAAKRANRNRLGFLVAGNGGSATVKVLEPPVASGRADMDEPIRFQCTDDVAGGNPFRDVQTVTRTAADSVDAIRAAGGISLPSPTNSSTIMWSTS